jgi:hypothetical protein
MLNYQRVKTRHVIGNIHFHDPWTSLFRAQKNVAFWKVRNINELENVEILYLYDLGISWIYKSQDKRLSEIQGGRRWNLWAECLDSDELSIDRLPHWHLDGFV